MERTVWSKRSIIGREPERSMDFKKDFISFREAQTKTVTLNPEPNKTSSLTCFQ